MLKETPKFWNGCPVTITKTSPSPPPFSGAPSLGDSLASSPELLDTLEQLPLSAYYAQGTTSTSENPALKKKLLNRSRSKFVTSLVSVPLSRLNSPLQKAYKLTEKCSCELTEQPGKLTATYCGGRWCLVCSRIRTAKLINGYLPVIEAMPEKWFLTLSRPNCTGAKLKAEIALYIKTAQLIGRNLREKGKLKFSFIRKIESTYNEVADTYHPHFHFVFDSEIAAQMFLADWLHRMPTAELNKGNQLIKADNNSVAELFKYFTKVVSKAKNGKASDYRIHLKALDTMFCAMKGVRTFQAGGLIKTISEEIETEQALESGRNDLNFWQWSGTDWMSRETNEALTGYVPSPAIQDIPNHIVYPAGIAPVVAPLPLAGPWLLDTTTGELLPPSLIDQNQKSALHNVESTFDNEAPSEPVTTPPAPGQPRQLGLFVPATLGRVLAAAAPSSVALLPAPSKKGLACAAGSNRSPLVGGRTSLGPIAPTP